MTFIKGQTSFNKGKPMSAEQRAKLSIIHKEGAKSVTRKAQLSQAGLLGAKKRWAKHLKVVKEESVKRDYRPSLLSQVSDHAEYMRLWRKQNAERDHISKKRYKARKKGAVGSHTLEEWEDLKRFYSFMCLCCKKTEPEVSLSEDHIIPLSKGGSDYIENLQPLCRSCNSRKQTKVISYLPIGSAFFAVT